MAQNVRIVGTTGDGKLKEIPVSAEGHIEVEVHGPKLPFGSMHVENLTPVFQFDGVYGVPTDQVLQTTGRAIAGAGSGSITGTSNLIKCSTGTTSYSFASLQSKKRLRYRPGQGVVNRFTAIFSEPAANSYLLAGTGTAESGVYFGYSGTTFGILHVTGGVREIRTLTVSTASTAAIDITVTLNGTANVCTGITNSGNTARTAYEIAQNTFNGWTAHSVGSTVVFLASDSGPKATPGTYSISQAGAGTPAAGSFAATLTGVASTDTFIPQTSWSGDRMDGTGPSGVTLDPQTGNVFQIDIQYLGFGGIVFKVEVVPDGNNPTWIIVHTIDYPNNNTTVSLSQPSFPFNLIAYSFANTTNIWVASASAAGFVEGKVVLNGPRLSYSGTGSSSTSAYTPIGTIQNGLTFQTKANQSIINVLDLNMSAKSTNGLTTLYILRDATLTGNPSFTLYDTTSCAYVDTAATGCSWTTNKQLVWSGTVSESGQIEHTFPDEIKLQPGDRLTFAVRSVTNTAVVAVNMNTREDH